VYNVVYLPGLMGSDLSYQRGGLFGRQPVWLDLGQMETGGARRLQLAADSLSPGPLAGGVSLEADSILAPCYGPLLGFMRALGWQVLPAPYDWRKSILDSARRVVALALQRFGSGPLVFVAHSMGGLVARAAVKLLANQGRLWQVQRVITLGTPQFGSWEIVRTFFHLPLTYRGLRVAMGLSPFAGPVEGDGGLDAILATWAGFYELLPCHSYGPLHPDHPEIAAALYQNAFYSEGNQYLSRNLFYSAQYTQLFLRDAVYADRTVSVLGYGEKTSYLLSDSGVLTRDEGYLYTQEGDGQVEERYASLPGVPRYFVRGSHGLLPLLPQVWGLLPILIAQGLSRDVRG
jgi:pimeloyl-ACP methyl ester carboxylesterase